MKRRFVTHTDRTRLNMIHERSPIKSKRFEMALLGRTEGDEIIWRASGGLGRFQIKKVIYQPEAARDFYM